MFIGVSFLVFTVVMLVLWFVFEQLYSLMCYKELVSLENVFFEPETVFGLITRVLVLICFIAGIFILTIEMVSKCFFN